MNTITRCWMLAIVVLIAGACTSNDKQDRKNAPLNDQVRVQVAYDATNVAFHFVWKTQGKTMPANMPSTGKRYPGHFHDVMTHNGTRFDRLPSGQRIEEDRVSFMIEDYIEGPSLFDKLSCAASCHEGMESHHLLTDNIIDHWHWRGGRSGPMDYAEDAALNGTERIRDAIGTSASKFTRSGGDRLREDQVVLSGTGHTVLEQGFPRFVFNKGKTVGGFTYPSFFIANESGTILSNPHTQLTEMFNLDHNRTLLVGYQDKAFDSVDKVNSLDLGYLVWVATGQVAHLPSHLRVTDAADHIFWRNYWATESGIAATASAAALTKLNEVVTEWNASNQKALIQRSVGFIYPSDQHDVTSERSYDAARNEWSVTLYRRLSTGSVNDADLAGIRSGRKYSFSFAMHDLGGGSETHNISMPLSVGTGEDVSIRAVEVSDVRAANWDRLRFYDTNYVKADYVDSWKWTYGWLVGGSHGGSSGLSSSTCENCHKKVLQYSNVLQ